LGMPKEVIVKLEDVEDVEMREEAEIWRGEKVMKMFTTKTT